MSEQVAAPNDSELQPASDISSSSIIGLLKKQDEWNNAVVFNQSGKIVGGTTEPLSGEVDAFLKLYDDRNTSMAKGIVFLGEQYDIHRFHDPLIYGRRGDSSKGEGEGIALCKVLNKQSNTNIYCLISYVFPTVSARAVPQLQEFCDKYLANISD